MTTCAIYGFDFTQPFEVDGLSFQPLYTHRDDASWHARNANAHHLTGTVSGEKLKHDQVLYRLEAVLSFIERLDVRLSEITVLPTAVNDPRGHFVEMMQLAQRQNMGGSAINPDCVPGHRDARAEFIKLAMAHLADDSFCERTKFRLLFIKAAESCRQRSPFIEVSYFLLFTGLEAFARAVQNNDRKSYAAAPIARTLATYGFNVVENSDNSSLRSISNYTHVRNSIFHNGELSKTVNVSNGGSIR